MAFYHATVLSEWTPDNQCKAMVDHAALKGDWTDESQQDTGDNGKLVLFRVTYASPDLINALKADGVPVLWHEPMDLPPNDTRAAELGGVPAGTLTTKSDEAQTVKGDRDEVTAALAEKEVELTVKTGSRKQLVDELREALKSQPGKETPKEVGDGDVIEIEVKP